jgi:mRNA interferase RelE/StbE
MALFNILLTKSASDDLDAIPDKLRIQIISDIQSLTAWPFPSGIKIKKLKGFKPPLYRLRAGDFRVLYRIDITNIIVMRVIARKELEKIIKRIKI